MKIGYRNCLILTLSGGVLLTPQAIFSAPPGKQVRDYTHQQSLHRGWYQKSSKKLRPVKGGYLAARVVPPVEMTGGNDTAYFTILSDPDREAINPSLRGFLAYLEEERTKAMEAEPEEAGESGPETTEPEPADTADGEQADASPAESSDKEGGDEGGSEGNVTTFQTTSPLLDQQPLFPRPARQRFLEERFYLYFPVDGAAPEDMKVGAPVSYDAIFMPPGSPGMRSTATLKEGP